MSLRDYEREQAEKRRQEYWEYKDEQAAAAREAIEADKAFTESFIKNNMCEPGMSRGKTSWNPQESSNITYIPSETPSCPSPELTPAQKTRRQIIFILLLPLIILIIMACLFAPYLFIGLI